jgi:hypothetical protein
VSIENRLRLLLWMMGLVLALTIAELFVSMTVLGRL